MIYCDATLPLPRTPATELATYNESTGKSSRFLESREGIGSPRVS
jgi:hypothetical protein